MTVDQLNVPTERLERARDIANREYFGGRAEGLLTVEVDDRDEVPEAVMRRELSGFPHRSLVQLTVAQQHERAVRASLHPGRERDARSDRQTLAQRSGPEVDARDGGFRVHAEARARAPERVEFGDVETVCEHERGKESQRGVTLREHEAISVLLVVSILEYRSVERGKNVRDRKRRADMADSGAIRVLDDKAADARRQGLSCRSPSVIPARNHHGVRVTFHARSSFKRAGTTFTLLTTPGDRSAAPERRLAWLGRNGRTSRPEPGVRRRVRCHNAAVARTAPLARDSPEIPTALPADLRRDRPRFSLGLAVIVACALVFRLAYTLALRHRLPHFDGLYYHYAAVLLREGHAFVNPFNKVDAAFHPPLWTIALTIPPLLGWNSQLAAQVFACIVGATTVGVIGLAGRRVISGRGGLIAAVFAAAYPGLWVYERALLSETLLLLGIALIILASYRYLAEATLSRAAVLGALCGLVALTHSEQILLVPFLLVPLILGWHWREIGRPQLEKLGVACATVALVIAPWTIYNQYRLHQTVLLSTSFGSAMAQGNCDPVYSGKQIGYYDFTCQATTARQAARHGAKKPLSDAALRRQALRYMSDHRGRVPLVTLAREGRTWSLFKPFETAETEYQYPQKPWWPQAAALFSYWALIPFAVAGLIVLRRRRVALVPLVAPFAVVVVATVATYGEPRLRAAAEVPLVLLAAVAVECLVPRAAPEHAGAPLAEEAAR